MLRNGFVPFALHGLLEYVAGILFVAAPFVLDFDSGSAKAVSIVLGVGILVLTAASDAPTGLSRTIPLKGHAALDYAIAGGLIASPFLFGFSDEDDPTTLFVAVGVFHLLLSIATRYLPREEGLRREERDRGADELAPPRSERPGETP